MFARIDREGGRDGRLERGIIHRTGAAHARKEKTSMATSVLTRTAAKGGSFLLESPRAEEIFTPADLSDDQKLIGQTGEEFLNKEVLPLVKELEEKKPGLMVALAKKAGELGLLGGGVPEAYGGAGLNKISTTVLTEKISGY